MKWRRIMLAMVAIGVAGIVFVGNHVIGKKSDEDAIKDCIGKYLQFARDRNETAVADLLSWTPPEYWLKDSRQTDSISESEVRATASSNESFDISSYNYMTGDGLFFLTAGKSNADMNQIGPIIVKGKFARAFVSLSYNSGPLEKDFLLQKKDGKWMIFRIDAHDPENTFPK